MSKIFNILKFKKKTGKDPKEQSINSSQPLEIHLHSTNERKRQILVKNEEIDEYEPIKDYEQDVSHGLISQLNMLAKEKEKMNIRIMICITVYNESSSELEKTIEGVKENLITLQKELGIKNQEIAVVILFDGIEKMNEDMFDLFSIFDLEFNIEKKYSLQNQHQEYIKYMKYQNIDPQDSFQTYERQGNEAIQLYQQLEYDRLCSKFSEELKLDQNFKDLTLRNIRGDNFTDLEKQKFDEYHNKYYLNSKERSELEQQALIKLKKLYQVRAQLNEENQIGNYQNQQNQNDYEIKEEEEYPFINQNDIDYRKKNTFEKKQQQIEEIEEKLTKEIKDDCLNMFFCVKYRNAQKFNSHLWFFKGFCDLLQPDYVTLLDCGLELDKDALYQFLINLERDKDIGGACGFMGLRLEDETGEDGKRLDGFQKELVDWLSGILHTTFSIQDAQVFEYNFAHIIDKPFESLSGFIHVLPGAFSFYRFSCFNDYEKEVKVQNENGTYEYVKVKESILDGYLKTQLDPEADYEDLEEANMYLAEDRILSLSLYCRFKQRNKLQYIPTAHAKVDPILSLVDLMGQRRRWLNGSWFALNIVYKMYWNQVQQSNHGWWGKTKLILQMYYALLGQLLTFLSVAVYFSILMMVYTSQFEGYILEQPDFVTNSDELKGNLGNSSLTLISLFMFIYFMIIGAMIFYSLQYNHKNKNAYAIYYGISTILGVYMLISFYFMVSNVVGTIFFSSDESLEDEDSMLNSQDIELFQWMIYATLLAHIIPILLNPCHKVSKMWELARSSLSYMFYMPSYIHLFIIHAFCRIDDTSWATKGSDTQNLFNEINQNEDDSQEQKKKRQIQKMDKEKEQKEIIQNNQNQKFRFFFRWILWNMFFAFVFSYFARSEDTKYYLLYGYAYFAMFVLGIRTFGAILFYIKLFITNCSLGSFKVQLQNTVQKNSDRIEKKLISFYSTLIQKEKENLQQYKQQTAQQQQVEQQQEQQQQVEQQQEQQQQPQNQQIFNQQQIQDDKQISAPSSTEQCNFVIKKPTYEDYVKRKQEQEKKQQKQPPATYKFTSSFIERLVKNQEQLKNERTSAVVKLFKSEFEKKEIQEMSREEEEDEEDEEKEEEKQQQTKDIQEDQQKYSYSKVFRFYQKQQKEKAGSEIPVENTKPQWGEKNIIKEEYIYKDPKHENKKSGFSIINQDISINIKDQQQQAKQDQKQVNNNQSLKFLSTKSALTDEQSNKNIQLSKTNTNKF